MIYLDSAATSLLKPPDVGAAVSRAMYTMASPGRGSHEPAMLAADTVLDCRTAVGELMGCGDPERVIFTFNATHGLNIAINGLISRGDRVVVSGYEHNAVMRPLHAIGADVLTAPSPLFDQKAAAAAFKRRLPGASAAVCTWVSNVFGFILPIEEIADMCRYFGVPLIVDASQAAGTLDIDFDSLGAEYLAAPGHKGLLGPQGTGVLLCRKSGVPLMHGGTGSESANPLMPAFLPDRLEAGTHNVAGLAGLLEGVKYVASKPKGRILEHERKLMGVVKEKLSGVRGLEIFSSADPAAQSGVLSVRSSGLNCELIASELGERGIAVRAGLHCAPYAHKSAGTFDTGTVRLSFSPFNSTKDAASAADALEEIVKNPKNVRQ